MTIDNAHKNNQGRKVLNAPNLRFPEFQGEWEEHYMPQISDSRSFRGSGKNIIFPITLISRTV